MLLLVVASGKIHQVVGKNVHQVVGEKCTPSSWLQVNTASDSG